MRERVSERETERKSFVLSVCLILGFLFRCGQFPRPFPLSPPSSHSPGSHPSEPDPFTHPLVHNFVAAQPANRLDVSNQEGQYFSDGRGGARPPVRNETLTR